MSIRRSGGLSLGPGFRRWFLAIAVVLATAGIPCRGDDAATLAALGKGRYLVEVEHTGNSADLENTIRHLAATVGGRLEPYASMDMNAFVIVMSPSKVPILRGLAQVKSVTELAGRCRNGDCAQTKTSGAAIAVKSSSSGASQAAQSARFGVAVNASASWSSGTYKYDSAGDIRAIGADKYVYDTAGRLVSGTADKERSGLENRQDYSYDGFGNRTFTTTTSTLRCAGGTDCAVNPGVDPKTNRVSGYEYDDAGNVEQAGSGYSYEYDGTGSMVKETFPGGSWQFVYTADGNRLATYGGGSWHWTVRDEDGTVLREFTSVDAQSTYGTASWAWMKDYVYRGTRLLAAESPAGRSHFHLDHLGTPRLITGDAAETIAYHSYYPFGAELEILPREGVEEHLKFTGHERDTIAGDVHTLDYMRARYASPFLGRFTSIDPVGGDPTRPQSWNRYAYVRNNPILLSDFTGMVDSQEGGCTQGTMGGCASIAAQQLDKPKPLERTPKEVMAEIARLAAAGDPLAKAIIADNAGIEPTSHPGEWLIFGWAQGMVSGTAATTTTVVGETATAGSTGAARTTLARELGKAGEEAVGIAGPKHAIPSLTRTAARRIPDRMTTTTIEEVKNTARVTLTNQLRDFHQWAQYNGLQFILHVRSDAVISPALKALEAAGKLIIKPF